MQENKLGVNSTLKEFIDNATISRDCPHEWGSGLFNGGILPNVATAEVLAVEVDLKGGGRVDDELCYCPCPPAVVLSRIYATDFDALLEDHGDQIMLLAI